MHNKGGLSKGAQRVLGNLFEHANVTVREAILLRGGGGSQIHQIASGYASKTLGELAELAATGDSAAKTAMKIVKQAAPKAQKYAGK